MAAIAVAPHAPARTGTGLLRIADVTVLYGARSGGIRTYLDAKTAWARRTGAVDQHLVVPGAHARTCGTRHEVASVACGTANGYRLPLGGAEMHDALEAIAPDVVLLHDPFWMPARTARAAHARHRTVVAVHHTSVALNAGALPGGPTVWTRPLRRWYRHAYREVDAVMSVADPVADTGRHADLPLRFGLDPAFRPSPAVRPGDHVLCVSRFSPEKGVGELLDATARGDWPLLLHGTGQWEGGLRDRVAALRLGERVRVRSYLRERDELAAAFARASCVVVPGAFETFGLVALEAAACGVPVVVADTAPSGRLLGPLAHVFRAGDVRDLGRAIAAAREAPHRPAEGAALGRRHGWDAAFTAELHDLARLRGRA